ncbi:MAG: thioredoxin family protein [Alphaproteobacteria bacterium]|nr:thioredoxin family protein [Alphaproteobacteria bacterium]
MRKLADISLVLSIALACQSIAATASTSFSALEDGAEAENFSPFHPSENAMAEVKGLLQKAADEHKLAMIIVGANWCHDSIGFMRHLDAPAVRAVVKKKYLTKTVDVGFLEHGKDIVGLFGLKAIYGTPTVMIVDPATKQLLNADTIHHWRDAAAMSDDEVLELLSGQASTTTSKEIQSPELKRLLGEIDAFEAKHAARIYQAFTVIGPMLAAEERPADFGHYWGQVRDLRYGITEDLKKLRQEAHARVEAGETGIELPFPDYPAFDWEE